MGDVKVIRGFGILYRTFLSYISKSLSSKDLSFSDSVFLVNIGDNEGTNQEEIANSLAIDKAAIARSVKDMENFCQLAQNKSVSSERLPNIKLNTQHQIPSPKCLQVL